MKGGGKLKPIQHESKIYSLIHKTYITYMVSRPSYSKINGSRLFIL